MLKDEMITEMHKKNIYQFTIDKSILLSSGQYSDFYFDARMIFSNITLRSMVLSQIVDYLNEEQIECDAFCGVATGGIPFSAALSIMRSKPMLYHRKAKNHGLLNCVEGIRPGIESCIVIEDSITTGDSVHQAILDIENAGIEVFGLVSIFSRKPIHKVEKLQEFNFPKFSVVDFDDLIK
ncbi:MAG: orotate phosphoribosyltransferase [Patescibacteria group bacterium]